MELYEAIFEKENRDNKFLAAVMGADMGDSKKDSFSAKGAMPGLGLGHVTKKGD